MPAPTSAAPAPHAHAARGRAHRAFAGAAAAPRRLVRRLRRLLPGPATARAAARAGAAARAAALPRAAGPHAADACAAAAAGPAALVWFRSDLRLHDHPALAAACAEAAAVLPVYVFDPRDYGRSPAGYGRTGPYRARFLLEAVADLRARLRAAGSELAVRVGRPEEVLPELARRLGARAVFCHAEATAEEAAVEARVGAALRGAGRRLRPLAAGALHDLEDLPFSLDALPHGFDAFWRRVRGVPARPPLPPCDAPRPPPPGAAAAAPAGELPTLAELGLEAPPAAAAARGGGGEEELGGGGGGAGPGGETEALRRMAHFAAAAARGGGAAPGASVSGDVAPWLAAGCLSPRRLLAEVRAALSDGGAAVRAEGGDAAGGSSSSGGGLRWVEFELLWRDFLRLLTQRQAQIVLPRVRAAVAEALVA